MDKTGRAPGSIPEPELQEFHTGAAAHAYRTFGCHALSGAAGHRFAVWAPHAQHVALVGDFNGWDAGATPMDRLPDGTWVQTVDGLHLPRRRRSGRSRATSGTTGAICAAAPSVMCTARR